ncbi:MAG: hypothetical protein SGJ02_06680 [bacterium]|nr:hypothetical protein [bacterium]
MSNEEDKEKNDTVDIKTLNLQSKDKYQSILGKSLETYKDEVVDESDVGAGVAKPIIYEPWSIKKIRIFGSTWFVMLIFLLVGNFLIFGVFRLSTGDAISQSRAEFVWNKTYSMFPEEFQPFEKFLNLSPEVSDQEYSSFLQALTSLNKHFNTQEFSSTAYFQEEGFHFSNQGIYYADPK